MAKRIARIVLIGDGVAALVMALATAWLKVPALPPPCKL
jgi:hypothetical protein